MRRSAAGWYPDPATLGAARYWDGTGWTSHVAYGGRQFIDTTPLEVVQDHADAADAEIARLYVQDAVRRGLIGDGPGNALLRDLDRARHQSPPAPPVKAVAARPVSPVSARVSAPTPARPAQVRPQAPVQRPQPTPTPARIPVPVQPGVVALWWQRVRHAVVSDLAVHGLAYLGVLLLFCGVFGLIAFSSGDMAPAWRGVADLLAPTAFFSSAWYLRRRRAGAVAAALTLLGGAILPIVAIACVTDGSNVPPDIAGSALPITQGLLCAAIAGWMIWAVARWPHSSLRFVAMPTLWLGAGVATGLARDPIPTGEDTARPAAVQIAAILAALCVTVVVLRLARQHGPVASAVLASAMYVATALFLLELLVAGNHDWPVSSGVIAAASMLVLFEALAGVTHHPRAELVTIGQAAALLSGALRLLPEVRADWTGAVLAALLLGLAEYAGHRRPTDAATGIVLAAALAAVAMAAPDPGAGLLATGSCAAWTLWRHWRPALWMPTFDDGYGVLPAVSVSASTLEFWRLVDTTTTMLTLAGVGLAIALLPRAVTAWRQDRVLRSWPLAMTTAALIMSITIPWDQGRERALIVAACATLTVAIGTIAVVARTWLSGILTLWTLANAAAVLDVTTRAQTMTLAALGAMVVVFGLFVRGTVPVHAAYLGHLVSIAAICVPGQHGWTPTVTVASATAAWAITAVVHEWRGAPTITTIATALRTADGRAPWIDQLPILATTGGVCATSVLALHASGAVPAGSPWAATAISSVAVVVALAARFVRWHRASPMLLHGVAMVLSLGAAAASELIREPAGSAWATWPMVVAIGSGLAVVMLAATPRPQLTVWIGWAETAPLAVLLTVRAGLATRWADLALAAWGASAVLGALVVDRWRHGAAGAGVGLRQRWLLPPLTLGAIGLLVGLPVGYIGESPQFAGWLSLAAAAVMFTAALIRPSGSLSLPGWGLLTASLALLPQWHPYEHPWVLVPWAGLLMGAAWLTRVTDDNDWRTRWDLPAFTVGHLVLGWALIAARTYGSVAATYLSAAVLTFAVAAVVPHSAWAVAGLILTLAGAADSGLGWLALAFLVEGFAISIAGLRLEPPERPVLLVVGAMETVAAWVTFVRWLEWPAEHTLLVTAPAAAVIALVSGLAIRSRRVPMDVAATWALTGALGSLAAMTLLGQPNVGRLAGGLVVAGSLVLLAVAVASTAPVFGTPVRWVAVAPAAVALITAGWAVEMSAELAVYTTCGIGLGAAVMLIGEHALHPTSPWIRPALLLAALVQSTGWLAFADITSHGPTPLVVLLLAAAGEAAALAIVLEQPGLHTLTPLFGCGAWLAVAADQFAHEVNWFTMPIGVTLLVVVGLVRWIRRTRGGKVAGRDIAVSEFVAMAFIVAPPLTQTIVAHLWYSLLAVTAGFVLAGWGVATHVRRRAAFGAGTVVLAALVVVGVPLAQAVPTWHGPSLWLALAGVGALAILIATLIEQGRATVRRLTELLDEITNDWEHTDGPEAPRDSGGLRGGRSGGLPHPPAHA